MSIREHPVHQRAHENEAANPLPEEADPRTDTPVVYSHLRTPGPCPAYPDKQRQQKDRRDKQQQFLISHT